MMRQLNRLAKVGHAVAVLLLVTAAGGCGNSSGSLGKGKLSILNLVSIEGEGITWDNRPADTPAAGTEATKSPPPAPQAR